MPAIAAVYPYIYARRRGYLIAIYPLLLPLNLALAYLTPRLTSFLFSILSTFKIKNFGLFRGQKYTYYRKKTKRDQP